jgi:hypothetical protein
MLTIQETFDKIVERSKYLVKSQSTDGCAYRGDGGTCCFAGVLIEYKHYSPALEGRSAFSSEVQKALRESGVNVGYRRIYDLVNECQKVHDNYAPDTWETELRKLAATYNLEYKP